LRDQCVVAYCIVACRLATCRLVVRRVAAPEGHRNRQQAAGLRVFREPARLRKGWQVINERLAT
jgi:hypothetical protein